MAQLIYLDNPQDRTVTWMGHTRTRELIEHARRQGFSPWTGRPLAPDELR